MEVIQVLKIKAYLRALLLIIGAIKPQKSKYEKQLVSPQLLDNTKDFILQNGSENDE